MPLIGALINRADDFSRLNELRRRLLKEAAHEPRSVPKPKPRHGMVQEAVIKVLAAKAPQSMSAKDIAAAVERLLGMQVSRNTVHSCLSTGACEPEARFERLGRGCYRLRK
jgi:hypothetical protein